MDNIEKRFKEISGIPQSVKIDYFPIIDHIGFEIRLKEKGNNGEVFTPLEIVDKMINISNPKPNKFNMDLCSGWGQFTVRILRYFKETYTDFELNDYIKNFHWFNELNIESAKHLIYIFGTDINLAIGPGQELKNYPQTEYNVWERGIYYFNPDVKRWLKQNETDIEHLKEKEEIIDSKIKYIKLF